MSVALIIRISRIEAEAIPAAVKIAAALLSREHIPETEAPKTAHITVRKWDKIRHHMTDIFSFTGGRITLLRGETLDAFDLAALRSDWQAAKTASQGKYPTDPRILDVIDLGIEPKQATSLAKFIVKTYGESHLLRAIKVAKEKTPRVSLEVDQGCLTALFFLDPDSEPVAKLTLGENAVFVAPTHSAPGAPPSDLALTSGGSTWHHALPEPRLT